MPDIFFTCKTCGKGLIADDALAGLTTNCPDCNTSAAIPTVVIVHHCPHCNQILKFARDMKGEVIDCSSCNKEVFFPDQPVVHRERLLSFVCPRCGVELEAAEEMADQLTTCPSCDAQVRLRPKLRLRTDSRFLTPVADSEQLPQDTPSSQPEPAKFPRRFGLLTLLRYGVVDILLLVLLLIPLPALNGHNFFYILKLSITGSQPGLSQPVPSMSSDVQTPAPLHSKAWNRGYAAGRSYNKMDRDSGTHGYVNLDSADQARIAAGYTAGTTEYNDFWDGYRQGYAEKR